VTGAARVAVVGPGSIGSTIAAAIAQRAGTELILCGRTPLEGLVVEHDDGEREVVAGPVLTDPEAVTGPAAFVFLAVKAHQTESAAPWLRALCDESTVVVVLQNGVEQRALVAPHARGAAVVPTVIWMPAEATAPGHVRVRDVPRLTLPDEPAARAAGELFDGSRLRIQYLDDFVTDAWRKLAANAVAGLMALSGRRAAIYRRDDVRRLARALAAECVAVARAEGANLPDAVADEIVDWCAGLPEDLGTSMLFDREAGRALEWDARNGVVVRRGAVHGVPTPVSDVIVPLLAAASG
jgi:2-dehydropantoate 2-reductase